MSVSLKLFITSLCLAACAALGASQASAGGPARQTNDAAATPRALTEQERRGKELYLRGLGAKGREVVATVGEVEALKRAGADLTRERLIAALESLYDFETGILPRVTFGPNRRVGAPSAYILTFDPAKKDYVLAGGWVKAN